MTLPARALPDPMTVVQIGGDQFVFSAAHTGLHGGLFEPLHGHTFTTTVYLAGHPDPDTGVILDFTAVKAALREAIAPLRRRVLMPGQAPEVTITHRGQDVEFNGGGKRYVLPISDVVVLPMPNTTTEALAGHLLEKLWPMLPATPRLVSVRLELAEAADTRASVTRELP